MGENIENELDDGDEDDIDVLLNAADKSTTTTSPIDLISVESPPELAATIKSILNTYESCFREEVNAQPAVVPPFQLEVDRDQWDGEFANKQAPRFQTPRKETDLEEFIGDKEPSWQSWSFETKLNHAVLVPDYLKQVKLARFIPAQYKRRRDED